MRTSIKASPSFSFLVIELMPGEFVRAEAGALICMDTGIQIKNKFNGGFIGAMLKYFLGGESLFINEFRNRSMQMQRLFLSQKLPGMLHALDLHKKENGLLLQSGSYVASSENVKLNVRWGGLASFLAREGLFKLWVTGEGQVWVGAYGGLELRDIEQEHVVDSGHLVAYQPHLKLRPRLAGGIFSSFFSGEGLLTRVIGRGTLLVQTRSLETTRDWLNPQIGS